MTIKFLFNPFSGTFDAIDKIPNPLVFKGSISVNTDFPLIASVETGWFYTVSASVTDNAGVTYTNTGQSFVQFDEIAWNGTNWSLLGNNSSDLHLNGDNQASWTPTATLVTNLNADLLDGHQWSEVPVATGQYEGNFLISDWTGASAPYAYSISAATHGQGASKHLHVTTKKDLGSTNEVVYDSPIIADDGTVTIYTNSKFDGNVQIGKLGGIGSSIIYSSIGASFDGVGAVILAGLKTYISIPYNCTIKAWTIIGDTTGSAVVDVWKSNNAIPTISNTITGSEKPTLSAAQINSDISLSTWVTNVSAGDVFCFNVDSCSLLSKITVSLKLEKN
jgi:hypothetical protein